MILTPRLSLAAVLTLLVASIGTASRAQSLSFQPALTYSTSTVADDLPELPLPPSSHFSVLQADRAAGRSIRPFSTIGIAVTAGTGGLGLQIATPLADHFNLRLNGSYFSYYANFSTDGVNVTGRILPRSLNASIDYFPFHNGFHISPGVTLDNANAVHGTLSIPAGQSFDLGDGTYTSSASDPVTGAVAVSFGNRVAPSFTVGWGNLIARRSRHFSVPVDIGFEYIGAPLVAFNLQGTACDENNNCGQIQGDPSTLANEQQQRDKINNDIRPLRFYPILSLGFGFSF
jgi:hypothetical protein